MRGLNSHVAPTEGHVEHLIEQRERREGRLIEQLEERSQMDSVSPYDLMAIALHRS